MTFAKTRIYLFKCIQIPCIIWSHCMFSAHYTYITSIISICHQYYRSYTYTIPSRMILIYTFYYLYFYFGFSLPYV